MKDFRRISYMVLGSAISLISMLLLMSSSSEESIEAFLAVLIGQYLAVQEPINQLYLLETSVNWVFCTVESVKIVIEIALILTFPQETIDNDQLKNYQISFVLLSVIGLIFIMSRWINDTTFLTHKQKKEGVFDWNTKTMPPKILQKHSEESRISSLVPVQGSESLKENQGSQEWWNNPKRSNDTQAFPNVTNSKSRSTLRNNQR
ncbi:hypothetical protein FGO68_gene6341 [Halteria grandinella]|uniref:Uncharacterized protein n=1 Tax=Halteria grandinella TaxID=5974 RepID=A0A8J8NCK5_HALGN|nr:hypothetical protein FGO68_gene6341 [Halteria grandinella]